MANYGPTKVFILVNGRDISGDTFTMEETLENTLEETHGFGDSWEETKPVGIAKVTLTAGGGLYDDRVAGINEALQALGSTQQNMMYGMSGLAQGAQVSMMDGMFASKWKRIGARDGITKANAEYTISGKLYLGNLIHPYQAETSATGDNKATSLDMNTTGNTATNTTRVISAVSVASPAVITSVGHGLVTGDIIVIAGTNTSLTINGTRTVTVVDANTFTVGVNTSSVTSGVGTFYRLTNQGAVIDLHISALVLGGYTNLTITPLHSTDNITFVTCGSAFGNKTTIGSERVTAAGLIRQYRAVSWLFNGAGSGQSVTFAVGIASSN